MKHSRLYLQISDVVTSLFCILIALITQSCLPETAGQKEIDLTAMDDYQLVERSFNLDQQRKIHIRSNFEVLWLKELEAEFLDGVKLFFDVNNNRLPTFERGVDKKFFLFDGHQLASSTGVKFCYRLISDTSYLVEAKIPFAALNVQPDQQTSVGFDCALVDNDGSGDLSDNCEVIWNSLDSDIFLNTVSYGALTWSDLHQDSTSHAQAIRTSKGITVDGTIETDWQRSTRYHINNVTIGKLDQGADLNATFRVMFDTSNLYFLFEVFDDTIVLKDREVKLCDYGWIEDQAGQVVWKTPRKKGSYAGGDKRNRQIDTTVLLPPGHYSSFFKTDESHAPSNWVVDPPRNVAKYGMQIDIL